MITCYALTVIGALLGFVVGDSFGSQDGFRTGRRQGRAEGYSQAALSRLHGAGACGTGEGQ